MTSLLLLGVDSVTLYAPGAADELGWVQPGTVAGWSGTGNLQLGGGASDPHAETGGGYGPHAPARVESGTLFLPADAQPADGMSADVRGVRWVLSQCRQVLDPAGGLLTCWVATATRDAQLGAGQLAELGGDHG